MVVYGFKCSINTIDYVTIASLGNATDFGDLPQLQEDRWFRRHLITRAVFGGGK